MAHGILTISQILIQKVLKALTFRYPKDDNKNIETDFRILKEVTDKLNDNQLLLTNVSEFFIESVNSYSITIDDQNAGGTFVASSAKANFYRTIDLNGNTLFHMRFRITGDIVTGVPGVSFFSFSIDGVVLSDTLTQAIVAWNAGGASEIKYAISNSVNQLIEVSFFSNVLTEIVIEGDIEIKQLPDFLVDGIILEAQGGFSDGFSDGF